MLGAVGQHESALVDVVDGGVEHGGDVLLLQEHVEQRLAVGQPADAEVPEERLRRDVGQVDLLLETGLAQLVGHVEQVLVGGAEAAGSRGGTDDDVARVVQEPPPALAGVHGVFQRGDRVGVAVRAEAGHTVEVVAVAGGDHQIVVSVAARRRLHRLADQVEAGRFGVHELDAMGIERRRQRKRDVRRGPLAERQPDQRRVEQEPVRSRHHRHVDIAMQLVTHRQRRRQPAEVATQHHHTLARHRHLLSVTEPVNRRPAPPRRRCRRTRRTPARRGDR